MVSSLEKIKNKIIRIQKNFFLNDSLLFQNLHSIRFILILKNYHLDFT